MPDYEIRSPFGPRTDPITNKPLSPHYGADIVGPSGAP